MKREKRHFNWNTARVRAAVLALIAVIAGYFAVRLAVLPRLEKQEAVKQQAALLESIREGDGVMELTGIGIDGEDMTFLVDEILEVLPGDQAAFEQPDDSSRLTLYTCTPIRTATHRLLVRATRVL